MRFHVLGLPNTQTTSEYSLDGFCAKTIRFCRLLKELGHTVYLYASEENEAPCDELVTVVTKKEQAELLDTSHYSDAAIDNRYPLWQLANPRMVEAIKLRKQPRDFICTVGGHSQKPVTDAFPDLMVVEYGIGYVGSYAPYRVFESNVWRHATYANQKIEDGRFYDTTIPNFFDKNEFPFELAPTEVYFLYAGRLTPRKGVGIAVAACRAAGVKLKAFGHGDETLLEDTEYLGEPDEATRNQIISKATAVLCPTTYLEPFGNVAVQAQMCGVPVICTDFGAFTETVVHGVTGFRCSILWDFVKAIKSVNKLDRHFIRQSTVNRYGFEQAKVSYQAYFDRLSTLWTTGWYWTPDDAEPNKLWYPTLTVKAEDEKAADAGAGMWAKWEAEVKAVGDQFAKSPIFIDQSSPAKDYRRVATWVDQSMQAIDAEFGTDRDGAHGARLVHTPEFGLVTRAWLDSNVEYDFLNRHTPRLSSLTLLDIGAGYGRLAISLQRKVSMVICTDAVETSLSVCEKYVEKYRSGNRNVFVIKPDKLHGLKIDLAMNIHSWNECSPKQIEGWLQHLRLLKVPYLFTVSHGRDSDGTSYRTWSKDGSSFLPMIKAEYDLIATEEIGLSNHPHALWVRRT